MKVLTIKQPYLKLILNGHKTVEIRSWKTKYRGELYLHASKKSDSNALEKYIVHIGENMETGMILGKCNLVDCILLTKDIIDELNKNNEVYQISHDHIDYYAWVLDSIEKIEPIIAKGKLSIWEY